MDKAEEVIEFQENYPNRVADLENRLKQREIDDIALNDATWGWMRWVESEIKRLNGLIS